MRNLSACLPSLPSVILATVAFAAPLHSQEIVVTFRNGANTAYCGRIGSGQSITRSFSTFESTHDNASVSDPGGTNWPASSAVSQLDATLSPTGITLAGTGSASRDPLLGFGVYATADTRDSWEFTLTAPARFTLRSSLSGSSSEALSPAQGFGFGGFATGQVLLDPGSSRDALGGGLTGPGTRIQRASGRLSAGRYSLSLNSRVEGTNFPFQGTFNSSVILELAPDAPVITEFRPLPQGFELKWTDLGGKQYTVETSDSLTGDHWTPVGGVAWPASTPTVVLPPPAAFPAFYRVRIH